LIDEVEKLKKKFVEIKVILTRINRLRIVREFKNIEVFTISKNIKFSIILEDAKLLLTIKNIEFSTMCEDIEFLTILINLISKEKLFSFIIRECARERQI